MCRHIRFRQTNGSIFLPPAGAASGANVTSRNFTTDNLQISVGAGFRF